MQWAPVSATACWRATCERLLAALRTGRLESAPDATGYRSEAACRRAVGFVVYRLPARGGIRAAVVVRRNPCVARPGGLNDLKGKHNKDAFNNSCSDFDRRRCSAVADQSLHSHGFRHQDDPEHRRCGCGGGLGSESGGDVGDSDQFSDRVITATTPRTGRACPAKSALQPERAVARR